MRWWVGQRVGHLVGRRVVATVAVLSLAIALAACSDDDGDEGAASTSTTERASSTTSTSSTTQPPSTTATTATTAPPATSGTAAPTCPGGGAAQLSLSGGAPGDTMLLTGVDAGAAGRCRDQVRFTFRSGTNDPPGYRVTTSAGPFTRGESEEPLEVPGSAFVVVRFEPAMIADLTQDDAPLTYTGPQRIEPAGTAFVRSVVLQTSFEGVTVWVIGLSGNRSVAADATANQLTLTFT